LPRVLLEVVAARTGYPADMLNLDMNLDTDLGIDSIKRVEILADLQERMPDAPRVRPDELGRLQTLRQIVAYLQPDGTVAAPANTRGGGDQDRMQRVLLEVVADRTGYPVDMLNLEMNLDTDLGIDSIKRVEILAAFQERMPDAPQVRPEELGRLQTLGQIVQFMRRDSGMVAESGGTPVADTPRPEPQPGPLYQGGIVPMPLAGTRPVLHLPEGAQVLVTDDGTDLTQDVCAAFYAHGYHAIAVSPDGIVESGCAALVILAPARVDQVFVRQSLALLQQAGRQGIRSLAGVTRFGGSFGIQGLADADPQAAALHGMIKTAAQEWQGVACKCIDIPGGQAGRDLARAIVDEILLAGPLEVGLAGGGRCGLVLESLQLPGPATRQTLVPGDLVVVSGGARGITAEVALALAETYKVNLLLLGRSQEPAPEPGWLAGLESESELKRAIVEHLGADAGLTPRAVAEEYRRVTARREVMANLKRLRSAGTAVRYCSVDIRDADQVAACVGQARRDLGPVRGLIHGAGVLADRLLADKTLEQFDQVYSTKVAGLHSLLKATAEDDLQALVLFSSSTARFGRKGQADYAAANEVLNKIAQREQLQRPGCRVLSINWGPWAGGMVTGQLRQVFAAEGVDLIPLRAGAEFLVRAIAADGPVEVVILGSAPRPEMTATAGDPAPDATLQPAFERNLNLEDFPVLNSHVMNGKAVLPAALITEWLAHGAMHRNPGLVYSGFEEFRICKGVILENGETVPVRILAGTAQVADDCIRIPVEMRSGNVLHARARIVLRDAYETTPAHSLTIPAGASPYTDKEFYRNGQLFHGRELQGLRAVSACSREGITGEAAAAPPPGEWIKQPIRSTWLADPLVLDACFQLMILWSFQHAGAGSLPTVIAGYRQFQRAYPKDGARIVARIKHVTKHRAVADIDMVDKQGKLVAMLEGYECVIDSSLNEAFRKNQVTNVARME
jgi:NAD(P)-dependent dehydrogenase (short-subunit alcohol dehydrogenase family)/acyl carrier protein